MRADEIRISVGAEASVGGLLLVPDRARFCVVMAHGAGAGMSHPFMEAVADGLAARGAGTLRFQFPYMEAGSKRPDRPALAVAAVRGAVGEAARRIPGLPLFAGGKSFGGRMTSQAQAGAPLPGVRGLVFLGFPLHPAGKPSTERADHLSRIEVPTLFLQGTRDALAELSLLQPAVYGLPRATLTLLDGADHSFCVPVKSGRTNEQVLAQALHALAAWAGSVLS